MKFGYCSWFDPILCCVVTKFRWKFWTSHVQNIYFEASGKNFHLSSWLQCIWVSRNPATTTIDRNAIVDGIAREQVTWKPSAKGSCIPIAINFFLNHLFFVLVAFLYRCQNIPKWTVVERIRPFYMVLVLCISRTLVCESILKIVKKKPFHKFNCNYIRPIHCCAVGNLSVIWLMQDLSHTWVHLLALTNRSSKLQHAVVLCMAYVAYMAYV